MSVKIRLKRMGAHKRPYYRIVVADSRMPRDGRFIETLGYYNPCVEPSELKLDAERIKHWLKNGAQPSERVARFLHAANLGPKVEYRSSPKKSAPKAKTQERLKAQEEAAKAAAGAAAAPAPVAEAPVAEAPAAEAPAA